MSLVRFAVWLAIVVWAFEYSVLAFQRFVIGERVVWYLESMWLAALAYVVVFALLGLLFSSMARGDRGRRLAIQVLTGVAALCVLLVFTRIHKVAAFVLAAGIGRSIGVLLAARETGTARLIHRTFVPFAVTTGLIVLGLIAFEPVREWRAYANLADADPDAPNVVLLILDTVRARELGLYGFDRPTTPALEAFARGGVTFDRAMATAPWTLPSHFSMLTGLYPQEMPPDVRNAVDVEMPPGSVYLADVMREHGYQTAGFVANMSYTIDETGLARGFMHWVDHTINPGQLAISTAFGRAIVSNGRLRDLLDWQDITIRKKAPTVNEEMLDWLDRHGDRPFFILANYFDAHDPYLPPPEFERRFVERRPTGGVAYFPHLTTRWEVTGNSPEELKAQRDMYDGAIASLDEQLGRLFGELDSRGLLENTVVIVTSDHGEAFGDHGRLGHGQDLYMELIHVPLIVSFRGRTPGGTRIADPVTLADLPATILDIAGIEGHGIPGNSLAPAWSAPDAAVPASPILSFSESGPSRGGILLNGWHYIRDLRNVEELYHTAVDTLEQRNLAADPTAAETLATLRAAFDSAAALTPADRMSPAGALARNRSGARDAATER